MEVTFVSGEKVPEFTDEGEIDLSVVIPAYNEKGKTYFHLYQKQKRKFKTAYRQCWPSVSSA